MAISFIRDDNNTPLHGPEGLRPDFAHVARANTGASITELDISSANVAANQSTQKCCLLRVSVVGSNACYFSLGAAGAAPGANTAMIQLVANSVSYFKARSTDVSAYHQQITGASSIEVVAMA